MAAGTRIESEVESQLKQLQLVNVTNTGKVIDSGAYGQVIEVYVHGTLCAAKEIHPILIRHDDAEQVKRSFQAECVKSSRIFHPNIVQVLGIYYPTPQAKLPWLVMELMDTSLKGLIDKREKEGIPLHFKLSMLVDVAQGLEFLHAQDIVHRDLSSNNVLLTKQLVAKIADLGVAKIIKQNKIMTQTQTPGTVHFMPPEALSNKPRYGLPVDVFSLACVALHLMSCKWPEPKDRVLEDSLIALTEVQRRDEYLQSRFCNIPTLRSLIEACLHNKPEKRPKVSEICMAFKNMKAFATANAIELYEEVHHRDQQKRNIEVALKNAEYALTKERAHVAALETTIAKLETNIKAKGQQLQQCHLQLAAEKARVAEIDKQQQQQQPRKTYLQMQSRNVSRVAEIDKQQQQPCKTYLQMQSRNISQLQKQVYV